MLKVRHTSTVTRFRVYLHSSFRTLYRLLSHKVLHPCQLRFRGSVLVSTRKLVFFLVALTLTHSLPSPSSPCTWVSVLPSPCPTSLFTSQSSSLTVQYWGQTFHNDKYFLLSDIILSQTVVSGPCIDCKFSTLLVFPQIPSPFHLSV